MDVIQQAQEAKTQAENMLMSQLSKEQLRFVCQTIVYANQVLRLRAQ